MVVFVSFVAFSRESTLRGGKMIGFVKAIVIFPVGVTLFMYDLRGLISSSIKIIYCFSFFSLTILCQGYTIFPSASMTTEASISASVIS